ncbi:MAG: hypothetical protein DRJ02_01765 [Bacteroidetes bacterium]|nr:MAG: hypothetical protein DRJ02_01765 [Bacteroidota bacterium]
MLKYFKFVVCIENINLLIVKVFVLNKGTSLHPRSIASNSRRLGVQAPENSQSYNKYSYAFNNPLKYTDPTGYTMEEWLNTVHNPYRNVIVSNSAHSINARSGFKYGTYRYNEKTGETINTWTGKAVSKQEVLLKMQLVKTGYVSVGFSTGEMVSYNGGEPFPEVVIKPIDVYEAKLKPQFVKANVESQDGEAGGGTNSNNGITSQEAAYGITTLGLSISGKTELFRLLEGSKNLPKYFKGASKLGMRLGFVGLGVTTIDGFTNFNGWQNHHYADLMIQGSIMTIAAFVPGVGWAVAGGYFISDLVFQHYHDGQSISEYYFDKP